jgi:thioredoxin-like negative regulator of GroEL
MTQPVHVNGLSFATEVLQSPLPVLIDVTASWCAPCKAAAPVIEELAARYAGRLKVVVIDGEESAELVATLGVRGFPTFLGVKGAEIVTRQAGFGGRRGLEALAEALLQQAS